MYLKNKFFKIFKIFLFNYKNDDEVQLKLLSDKYFVIF